jgi:hypothetical protein
VDLQRRSVGVTVFYPDSPARLNFAVPWGRNETVAVLKNHHAISAGALSRELMNQASDAVRRMPRNTSKGQIWAATATVTA